MTRLDWQVLAVLSGLVCAAVILYGLGRFLTTHL